MIKTEFPSGNFLRDSNLMTFNWVKEEMIDSVRQEVIVAVFTRRNKVFVVYYLFI